jgi:IS605 OrfB family transposase
MKLTLQTQLLPDADQAAKLAATVERFNAAANWLAGLAFERKVSNKFVLQRLCYAELRKRFGLPADTAIRCIAQVVEAYKRDKDKRPEFREHAAVPFSMGKNIGFKGPDRVSISTLTGRVIVPFIMGKYQAERFGWSHGQCDLVLRRDGKWFLLVTVDAPDGTPVEPSGFIGVDLGVKDLATTDDGTTFKGDDVEACRRKYHRIRKTCQGRGTKSARRKLAKVREKEGRFKRNENHVIAKRVVEKAKGTGCAIGVEDLMGISTRTTVSKPQRSRMKGWAFFQLRRFISYKAMLAGVPVVPVDPRNTSRMCSECGHTEKANRKSRDEFECRHCGFTCCADRNAARNIRDRAERDWAVVGRPIVGVDDAGLGPRSRLLTSRLL